MAKLKVKVIGSGKHEDAFRVNLPTYQMIPGTEKYSGKRLLSVDVIVPDDEVNKKGRLDKPKIRAKYKGQPKWDRADVLDDVILIE